MSTGDNWIKLLRAYGPIPDDNATEAEVVDACAKRLGLERLSFPHPERERLLGWYQFPQNGRIPTVVITGTAGDGKTTLCYEIIEQLTGDAPEPSKMAVYETIELPPGNGRETSTNLSLIFDLTGWRQRDDNGKLVADQVVVLQKIAEHAESGDHYPHIIAVNDGQIHEIYRALPENASKLLRDFFEELISLHATGKCESETLPFLRLVNLSRSRSEVLMERCLDGILSRSEWSCITEESDHPLFGPNSPLVANFRILSEPATRSRLMDIARLADACRLHLPIRSILMLLINALLGHPRARHGLLYPGVPTNRLLDTDQRANGAFHLNLFGLNLRPAEREKRNVYRFLALLQIGNETTNDIDELLIFGDRDKSDVQKLYAEIVANDPYGQRSKEFGGYVQRYLLGELEQPKDLATFLTGLADERRRVFLHASEEQVRDNYLWNTTAFHHAGDYVNGYLRPIRDGKTVPLVKFKKLVTGLNRIWTGMYVADTEHELYIASGLDMTTSPVSDILLERIRASDIRLEASPNQLPQMVLSANGRTFHLELTLLRFEFLMRAAEGAMPGSFSREASEDLMALKQQALRDLDIQASSGGLERLSLGEGGRPKPIYIHLETTLPS